MSYLQFGQTRILAKNFHSVYELTDIYTIDLSKVVVSDPVSVDHDLKYMVGYEVKPLKIIPLHIKTPVKCLSNGVK